MTLVVIMVYVYILNDVKFEVCMGAKLSLRVSENTVLRGMFGPMRDEATGGWRKLHNEGFHNIAHNGIKGYLWNLTVG
jgi:hypothetical protein